MSDNLVDLLREAARRAKANEAQNKKDVQEVVKGFSCLVWLFVGVCILVGIVCILIIVAWLL